MLTDAKADALEKLSDKASKKTAGSKIEKSKPKKSTS
jgi:hypothetical protein